ncbi:MAG: holo-ACP synthase [Acidimicrobiales bacterium]|nr:holo-ACP synthase [Acidimicrobiales bacterium]
MNVVGVGIDLVDVERFRVSLERTPSMLERMFTEGERAYALRANDPTERLAVRFAAKEAVMKALTVGLGAFGFHDVEVLRDDDGVPSLGVYGPALALADDRGVTGWQVSLTHTATSAGAVVVATGRLGVELA